MLLPPVLATCGGVGGSVWAPADATAGLAYPGLEAALASLSGIPVDGPASLATSLHVRAAALAGHREAIAKQMVLSTRCCVREGGVRVVLL